MDESPLATPIEEVQRSRKLDGWLFALVMIVALVSRGMTFNRMFERDPEGCGAFYGQVARNYFRQSLIPTLGVPIMDLGEHVDPAHYVFYPNHPPLLPLLIGGTYALCGWDSHSPNAIPAEWQTRLSSTFFTIALAASIFSTLRCRANGRAAMLAAIIFSIVPMTLMFGSQPDVISAQLCFFVLWTCVAYQRFIAKPSLATLALMSGTFFLAAATDWPAFHLCIVLGLHFVITQPRRHWGWIFAFAAITVCIFALLYGQAVYVTHDWHWMGRLVQRRALSSSPDHGGAITFRSWIEIALVRHGVRNHTWIFSLLTLAWLIQIAVRPFIRRVFIERRGFPVAIHGQTPTEAIPAMPAPPNRLISRAEQLVFLLLGWAIVHILVGRQGVFVHEWWWWPLTPAVAMASGLLIDQLLRSFTIKRINAAVPSAIVTIAILILGGWNFTVVRQKLSHPSKITNSDLDYSLVELGEAVRAAGPSLNDCVLLAESDESLGLWYYVDRPVKRGVYWDGELEHRFKDDGADLPFTLYQVWKPAPVSFVVPKAYINLGKLNDYCKARFPFTESGKFITYDLKRRHEPSSTQP